MGILIPQMLRGMTLAAPTGTQKELKNRAANNSDNWKHNGYLYAVAFPIARLTTVVSWC